MSVEALSDQEPDTAIRSQVISHSSQHMGGKVKVSWHVNKNDLKQFQLVSLSSRRIFSKWQSCQQMLDEAQSLGVSNILHKLQTASSTPGFNWSWTNPSAPPWQFLHPYQGTAPVPQALQHCRDRGSRVPLKPSSPRLSLGVLNLSHLAVPTAACFKHFCPHRRGFILSSHK